MPSSKTKTPAEPRYRIAFLNKTRSGAARELIEWLRADVATRSEYVKSIDAAAYAKILIRSAKKNLNPDHLKYLQKETYANDFDRALRYAAVIPFCGVRILKNGKKSKTSSR